MTDYKSMVESLREEAEAVKAIEWDIPICTANHIKEAADAEEFDILVEDGHMPEGYLTALSLIETIQAEDVVSVVRCKDCIHWLSKVDVGWCEINSRMSLNGNWNPFYENDYCSCGERKTDATV